MSVIEDLLNGQVEEPSKCKRERERWHVPPHLDGVDCLTGDSDFRSKTALRQARPLAQLPDPVLHDLTSTLDKRPPVKSPCQQDASTSTPLAFDSPHRMCARNPTAGSFPDVRTIGVPRAYRSMKKSVSDLPPCHGTSPGTSGNSPYFVKP